MPTFAKASMLETRWVGTHLSCDGLGWRNTQDLCATFALRSFLPQPDLRLGLLLCNPDLTTSRHQVYCASSQGNTSTCQAFSNDSAYITNDGAGAGQLPDL